MKQEAVFGGGCFWCLDAAYRMIKGVTVVTSGYTGGTIENPSYEDVCAGATGHVEAVKVTFDPKIVSYKDLLNIFFTVHDPTQLNRQGNDIGTQYRSAIFTTSEEQTNIARTFINDLETEQHFTHPIVTEVRPLDTFYPAEDYHQDFYSKHPNQGYCSAVINSKLSKLRKELKSLIIE